MDITNEAFNKALIEVIADDLFCTQATVEKLFSITGIYEVLSEEYNNSAIEKIEYEMEEDESDE